MARSEPAVAEDLAGMEYLQAAAVRGPRVRGRRTPAVSLVVESTRATSGEVAAARARGSAGRGKEYPWIRIVRARPMPATDRIADGAPAW